MSKMSRTAIEAAVGMTDNDLVVEGSDGGDQWDDWPIGSRIYVAE